MKYTESLTKLGLTKDQAKIYETLLGFSAAPVSIIAKKSLVGRELAYVVLGQLEQLGLIEKSTQGKINLFKAAHPRNIEKILSSKKDSVAKAESAYQEIAAGMVSDFNIAHHKPFVQFYEGIEGLQKTYDMIIDSAKTVYVIRSLFDRENEEIRSMVSQQLKKQAAKKIRSYVLSPHLPHMQPEKLIHNTERNITRKLVAKEKFTLPSQVMIFNDVVSITSLEGEMVTTVIESKNIAKTFMTLFNYMWESEN